ncbi:uncharacterized protein LOC143732381 [Siphateles boraxobius]|uniref:uncharacterized protein LOC143732381 n=1 Tax=Siphateles boraxobius TaxID=180520 RepID=UPI0040627F3E
MNLLYILLLVLCPAFNSSDPWYRYYRTTGAPSPSEPNWYNTPYFWARYEQKMTSEAWRITGYPSTPGASSNPCGYWYNKPCFWSTTQPSDTSTPHYQTQSKSADFQLH